MDKKLTINTFCFFYTFYNNCINSTYISKELSIPNFYYNKWDSKTVTEVMDFYLELVTHLDKEIDFIYNAENYARNYCIRLSKKRKNKLKDNPEFYYFSEKFNTHIRKKTKCGEIINLNLTEKNFFYFTSEFTFYIKKVYKQYNKDKSKLNNYDLFFLSFLNRKIYSSNLIDMYFVDIYNQATNNILSLEVFIYNLKYMLFNRIIFDDLQDIYIPEEDSWMDVDISYEERSFMLFIYSFENIFLSYLFSIYYIKRLDYDSKTEVDPILKDILLIFQEIFEIDLLSKYINYINGCLDDINDPLFKHLLYLYEYYSFNFKLELITLSPKLHSGIIIDDVSKELILKDYHFTFSYLKKVINGICFLNRKANLILHTPLSVDFFQKEYRPFLYCNEDFQNKKIIYYQSHSSNLTNTYNPNRYNNYNNKYKK